LKKEMTMSESVNEPCRYCGGNCPNDHDNMCDGYSGDVDNLYEGGKVELNSDEIAHLIRGLACAVDYAVLTQESVKDLESKLNREFRRQQESKIDDYFNSSPVVKVHIVEEDFLTGETTWNKTYEGGDYE